MTPDLGATLDAIRAHMEITGVSPSLADLGRALVCSPNTVRRRLVRLELLGHIRLRPNEARSIRLIATPSLASVATGALRAELARRGVTMEAISTGEQRNWGRRAVTCAVDACDIEVQRGHLMCRRHWFAVPRSMRENILGSFARKDVEEYQHLVWQAREIAAEVRA